MSEFTEEVTTTIDGWVVTYPAECNGAIRDLGFVYPVNGNSNFVHFDNYGLPYGTYMPKKVARRLVAMRRRHLNNRRDLNTPRYSVYLNGNGSTGYARDYLTTTSYDAVKTALKEFAGVNRAYSTDHEGDPAAWATVYTYDARNDLHATYTDCPERLYVIGPRDGIRRSI